jgi:hypothetical protein
MAMTDTEQGPTGAGTPAETVLDIGGLRFAVSFRAPDGATLRVRGRVGGVDKELLRFDDFVDQPHYHVPAEATPIMFDRATLGEPLAWFMSQVRVHLGQLLAEAGFAEVLPDVDLDEIGRRAGEIRSLMVDCVPQGYARVPGLGLQHVAA